MTSGYCGTCGALRVLSRMFSRNWNIYTHLLTMGVFRCECRQSHGVKRQKKVMQKLELDERRKHETDAKPFLLSRSTLCTRSRMQRTRTLSHKHPTHTNTDTTFPGRKTASYYPADCTPAPPPLIHLGGASKRQKRQHSHIQGEKKNSSHTPHRRQKKIS